MGRFVKTFFALAMLHFLIADEAVAQGTTILSIFNVAGEAGPQEFSKSGLIDLPQKIVETSTPWIDGVTRFEGPYLEDVLGLGEGEGRELEVVALNGFRARIPVSDVRTYGPILALKENGQFMKIRNRGPLFIVFPFDDYPSINNEIYFSRSVWQVREIHVR